MFASRWRSRWFELVKGSFHAYFLESALSSLIYFESARSFKNVNIDGQYTSQNVD
jgi:hypothetical protein